jgi:hypothetical protein
VGNLTPVSPARQAMLANALSAFLGSMGVPILSTFNYSVDNFVKWACGINNHPLRYIFFGGMKTKYQLFFFFIATQSSAARLSSLCLSVSVSTSNTNTLSNKAMNLSKFLEPPQKKVTSSSLFAAIFLTSSTSHVWFS